MKVVIDIPENVYQAIMDSHIFMTKPRSGKTLLSILISGVENGTPLPKGHGRLIDIDAVWNEYPLKPFIDLITDAPTVIEADKGVEDDS